MCLGGATFSGIVFSGAKQPVSITNGSRQANPIFGTQAIIAISLQRL
jgi:phosphotransacetylase